MICSSVKLVRFMVRPQVGPDSNRRWRKKFRGRSLSIQWVEEIEPHSECTGENSEPLRKGFGSIVIQSTIQLQLRGKLERTLTAQGILYGCSVQGPFTAVDETLDSLSEERPDVGLLDINLYQEFSYPVAERLNEMGIPFAFFTAYDDNTLPDVFVGRPIIPKNDRRDDIVAKVKGLLRV